VRASFVNMAYNNSDASNGSLPAPAAQLHDEVGR
jgi:hypothetical protein